MLKVIHNVSSHFPPSASYTAVFLLGCSLRALHTFIHMHTHCTHINKVAQASFFHHHHLSPCLMLYFYVYAHPHTPKSLQLVLPPKLQDKEIGHVQRRDKGYIGPRVLKVDLSGRSKRGKLVLSTRGSLRLIMQANVRQREKQS